MYTVPEIINSLWGVVVWPPAGSPEPTVNFTLLRGGHGKVGDVDGLVTVRRRVMQWPGITAGDSNFLQLI